jgi:hypothetical protein
MMTNNVSFNRNVVETINCMMDDLDASLCDVLDRIDYCVRYHMLDGVPASRVGSTVALTHTDAVVACMKNIDDMIARSVTKGLFCVTE